MFFFVWNVVDSRFSISIKIPVLNKESNISTHPLGRDSSFHILFFLFLVSPFFCPLNHGFYYYFLYLKLYEILYIYICIDWTAPIYLRLGNETLIENKFITFIKKHWPKIHTINTFILVLWLMSFTFRVFVFDHMRSSHTNEFSSQDRNLILALEICLAVVTCNLVF